MNHAALAAARDGRQCEDWLEAQIAAGRISSVIVALPTPNGLKGKQYRAAVYLDRVAGRSAEMSAYLLATDADMTPDPGFPSLGEGTGDLHAVPDACAVYRAPWQANTALVIADAFTVEADNGEKGLPIAQAPREILRRQVERLHKQYGITARLGLETEAHAYRVTAAQAHEAGYRNLDRHLAGAFNGDYALDHSEDLNDLVQALDEALSEGGLPLETAKGEASPGQIEFTYPPADPVAACDRHLVFKHAARAVAQRAGMSLSFMAAPHPEHSPSGLHLHVSLTDEHGRAVFAPAAAKDPITAQARAIIAGCLEFLPDAALFYAPSVNSYKRFHRPFTPSALSWGLDNRSAAIRVTGHGADRRIEMRLAGADASPYLAAAALLAGITHGLANSLSLTDEPVVGYAPGRAPGNAPDRVLPWDLAEASDRFGRSEHVRSAFGCEVVDHFVHAARLDLRTFHAHTTDWELRHGFTRA